MIFLVTIMTPGHKQMEVRSNFVKDTAKGLPKGVKKWNTFISSDGGEAQKGYHLIYVEKDKVDEVYLAVAKVLMPYSLIEGVTIKTEILMGMSDATKIASGMAK